MNITELTVYELKEKLEKKELTSYEITKAYTDRIAEKEKDVQAFVTTLEEDALEKAKEIDKKIESGEAKSELAGIPIGIKDNMDTTSVERPKVDYTKALKNDVKGLKIAVPKEFFGEGINAEVKENLEKAIETYKELGAEVKEVSLDIAEYALASYYIIACAEASSNLGRFDGVRYGHRAKEYSNVKELITNSRTEGFGQEVKRRIILGTYVLSSGYYDAYYKKAQQVRTLVMNEFKKVFDNYDVILTPTSPTVAFDIGSKINDPLAMYLADICTVSVNIAGLPGISIPCGVDSEGMPVGMQLIGNRFAEETLLNAAYTFEQKIKFREQYKPEFKK